MHPADDFDVPTGLAATPTLLEHRVLPFSIPQHCYRRGCPGSDCRSRRLWQVLIIGGGHEAGGTHGSQARWWLRLPAPRCAASQQLEKGAGIIHLVRTIVACQAR